MKTYQLTWWHCASSLPWEYEFTIASDEMAMEYARRHTVQLAGAPGFMGMVVWCERERLVGHCHIIPANAEIEYNMPKKA